MEFSFFSVGVLEYEMELAKDIQKRIVEQFGESNVVFDLRALIGIGQK